MPERSCRPLKRNASLAVLRTTETVAAHATRAAAGRVAPSRSDRRVNTARRAVAAKAGPPRGVRRRVAQAKAARPTPEPVKAAAATTVASRIARDRGAAITTIDRAKAVRLASGALTASRGNALSLEVPAAVAVPLPRARADNEPR